jgi:chemotaxis protein MotA
MDLATIIGLIMASVLVLSAILLGGGGLMPFIDTASVMIVIGGSIAATLINYPLKTCLGLVKVTKNCFLSKLPTPIEVIIQFKDLTQIARKDGIVALEERLEDIDDTFMMRGLDMVIGGSPKEEICKVMELELNYIDDRHRMGKKVLDSIAAAAPAFGMIGTLIGLIQMLRTLDDPSKIGGGMSVALLTTLYGAMIANMFCIPLAGKLGDRNDQEQMIRNLMITAMGLLSEGQSPRVMEEHLSAFLAAGARPEQDESKEAA